jgi:AAA domain
VAAIAGDPVAQQLVSAAPDADEPPRTDDPEDDYSVLDADSSQRSAIETVLAGRSLVIHGPPGTGKSQTIANLIAAMVARGRKVLFVAGKRAAIDAVLSRLVGVGLGELVLDIHEGTRDRQRIAAGLGATLDLAEHATAPDTTALHRRLTDRQRRLRRHAAALHRVHEPWRLSAYQVQSALLGVPPAARVAARLVRRHPAHPRRGSRGRRAGGHPVRQDAAEAGCPAGRRVQGNRSAPHLCQLSGTYAAYSPLQPPPRGGPARPWPPCCSR